MPEMLKVQFRKGTLAVPLTPCWTAMEIAAALTIVDEQWPALAEFLPADHIWRDPKRLHAKVASRNVQALHVCLQVPTGHLVTQMACLAAEVIDIGRVIDDCLKNGRPVPTGQFAKGQLHGYYSAELLGQWRIPVCFEPAGWEVLEYIVSHHSDRQAPKDPVPFNSRGILSFFLLATLRDAERLATFELKTQPYLWDESEKAKQTNAMMGYRPDFRGQSGELDPAAFAAFMRCEPVAREDCTTYESYMLQYLSWIFDLDFRSTIAAPAARMMVSEVLCYLRCQLGETHREQYLEVERAVRILYDQEGLKLVLDGNGG